MRRCFHTRNKKSPDLVVRVPDPGLGWTTCKWCETRTFTPEIYKIIGSKQAQSVSKGCQDKI